MVTCKNIAAVLPEGCMDARGEVVKGWPWGSGSHTNTVVAFLHWLIKWNILCILGHLFAKTKVGDRFSANKIGDGGL